MYAKPHLLRSESIVYQELHPETALEAITNAIALAQRQNSKVQINLPDQLIVVGPQSIYDHVVGEYFQKRMLRPSSTTQLPSV